MITKQNIALEPVVVAVYERVPTESGTGFTSREVRRDEVGATLEIDFAKLAAYVRHAAGNKGGLARLGGGAIKVRVMSRRPVR